MRLRAHFIPQLIGGEYSLTSRTGTILIRCEQPAYEQIYFQCRVRRYYPVACDLSP